MTPRMLDGLRWIAEHEPVALFPRDGPSRTIRQSLETAKLIETAGVERGTMIGLRKFRVSAAGHQVLKDER